MYGADRSGCVGGNSKPIAKRLSNYGIAALATAAIGVVAHHADAAQVTLPVNINSADSLETFIDILPFAPGANSIAVNFVNNSYSNANPLAPNSELMLRGVSGAAQLRPQNGRSFACFLSSGGFYTYVRAVPGAFVFPPNNNGTFLFNGSANFPPNPSLTYPGLVGGDFPLGSTHVAYFRFHNANTPGAGPNTDGWLTIQMNSSATSVVPTITAISVDTGTATPEPSSMALLCMGAVGLANYRRRQAVAN